MFASLSNKPKSPAFIGVYRRQIVNRRCTPMNADK